MPVCVCEFIVFSQALCGETGWLWPGTGDPTEEVVPVVPTDTHGHGPGQEEEELRVSVIQQQLPQLHACS